MPFADAAVWREERIERVEEDWGWTSTEHLLALTADRLDDVFRAVLAGRVRRDPKPRRVPRPTDRKAARVGWREVARRMQTREVTG